MHDLVIRDASVVDGTGRPRFNADIGVDDGRITAVGDIRDDGERTIRADGRIVAPGFVDVHTHYDAQAFWDTTLSPSPLHGVTTVFAGNCGFSIAPIDDASSQYVMRMLARVEGMPLGSLKEGVPWDWHSTADFLDRLDGTLSINTGFMVGHSALRRVIMGHEATERHATRLEVDSMMSLLRQGLSAGAIGFSSSWAESHKDGEGSPVPSRLADAHELVALAAVCREFHGTSLEFLPGLPTDAFSDEISELMIQMSGVAKRPLNWNLMTVSADTLDHWLAKLDVGTRAGERGAKVVGLCIPRLDSSRLSFGNGFGLDLLPGWTVAMTTPMEERIRLFRDPAERRRLEMLAATSKSSFGMHRWEAYVIAQTYSPETAQYEGRAVREIAAEEGKGAFDVLCDIAVADGLKTYITPYFKADERRDWEARARIWRDDRALVGGSDAGAHLDMISTYNYTTTLLEFGVRREGLLELEEAVRLLTDAPAQLYGLRDRGRIAKGAWADLVVFDEATVGPRPVRLVDDLPGGSERLTGGAHGIGHVLVAGQEIVRDDQCTEARPGRVLRSGRDTDTPALQ
jgi:N-acyl-D-aspartate/D-glutamate deacylase